MEITIERVSEHGFFSNGAWLNVDKSAGIDTKAMFHAGDVVNITQNAKKFITAVELVTKAPEKKAWTGGSKFGGSTGGKAEFRTTEQIIRSVAAEAAFGGVAASVTANMSKEEAQAYAFELAEHIATWIEKGV